MSNKPAKYEVLIKQYSRSILDISAKCAFIHVVVNTESIQCKYHNFVLN